MDNIPAFDRWDKGQYTFDGAMANFVEYDEEDKLISIYPEGEPIGNIFNWIRPEEDTIECTFCPVHNGTCNSMMKLEIFGFHPHKKGKKMMIDICSIGVSNIDKCPLSK
jgi:hypothetical protein